MQIFQEISCTVKIFALYLHSQNGNNALHGSNNAEIAQLVEHNLAPRG